MMNKKNMPLTPEAIATEQQSMIELNEQDLENVSGGWGGFDEGFGFGQSQSFEKTVIIKRRVSASRYGYGDFDGGW
ncbi:hypothetical protein [Dictyobacter formicarum]|uniref:Bacteriocin-type signal sequence n=1 Tax=Dictyobacter formicarum TaxID=2778368 RepID=A0ABQ3VFN6_9CHLR|nr:hypothetical protein [Dictyobacter formicarum]GHO84980.1 hypothetical protein KSZ_29860 [Dictyobacter formicarum]